MARTVILIAVRTNNSFPQIVDLGISLCLFSCLIALIWQYWSARKISIPNEEAIKLQNKGIKKSSHGTNK